MRICEQRSRLGEPTCHRRQERSSHQDLSFSEPIACGLREKSVAEAQRIGYWHRAVYGEAHESVEHRSLGTTVCPSSVLDLSFGSFHRFADPTFLKVDLL